MNWKRIFIFTAILFSATAAVAIPFGFIAGFLSAGHKPVPTWLLVGQGIAVPTAAVIVFVFHAMKQESRLWVHALLVALSTWLVSFPINVLALRQPILAWAAGIVVILITLAIGTAIGSYLRNKSKAQTQ